MSDQINPNDQTQNTPAAIEVPADGFELDGVVYRVLTNANIPGLGVRTKAEICLDEEAQQALVKIDGVVGTVLQVIE